MGLNLFWQCVNEAIILLFLSHFIQKLPLTFPAPRLLAVKPCATGRKIEIFSEGEKRTKILTLGCPQRVELRSWHEDSPKKEAQLDHPVKTTVSKLQVHTPTLSGGWLLVWENSQGMSGGQGKPVWPRCSENKRSCYVHSWRTRWYIFYTWS